MQPTRRHMLTALGTSMALGGMARAAEPPAEVTVFEAGRIVTMEPSQPSARFVAVADGMILSLADSLAELEPWTRGRKVKLDRRFSGQVLMPGFIDPHVHPMQAAVMLNLPFIAPDDWNLPSGVSPGVRTPEGYRQRLARALAGSDPSPFITWGYHDLFHGRLRRGDLDALSPQRPLVLWQRSFHEVIVNTAMLRAWGLDDAAAFDTALRAGSADPSHASLAEGLFTETALPVALAKLRPVIMTPARLRDGMSALQTMMRQSGVTTVSEMATGIFAGFATEAGLIREAFERPGGCARVMLMPMALELDRVTDLDAWLAQARSRNVGPHVRLERRVKMFADGAFFAQNMRMKAPGYADGHQGKWITEPAALQAEFNRYWQAGFSFHIHVNGDEGTDVVLDALEALPVRRGQTVTLEHLGFSTEAQNRRIARMGLMVSAQPNYIRVLGDIYATEGLGPDRAATMNRLGSLERKGVPLGLHSDFNMAPIDPLYLAWVAANRITVGGVVKAPEERISLDKALRAITIEAAQVIGMDALVGSIAAGKRADFAVLERDPASVGAAGLKDLKVLGVIYEGVWTPNA